MPGHAHATYQPLNTLKPVADNLWIVDGPEIEAAELRRAFAWLLKV